MVLAVLVAMASLQDLEATAPLAVVTTDLLVLAPAPALEATDPAVEVSVLRRAPTDRTVVVATTATATLAVALEAMALPELVPGVTALAEEVD